MIPAKIVLPLLLCVGLAACAKSISPEDVRMSSALSTQGKTLLADGKNAEARDIYLSAISRDEKNARAWNGLGVSYDLLGKREKAQEAYRHALDLAPKDMTVANNLAHLYLEKGDPVSAKELLAPFANNKSVPEALKQNLAKATSLVESKKRPAETIKPEESRAFEDGEVYADLGSFPTDAMAQNHMVKAKAILNDDDYSFDVEPEVKVFGGTPVFTVKALGKNPQAVCKKLNSQAIPCNPKGK
jgi:tetratricopeptide (TPR) repeat protein